MATHKKKDRRKLFTSIVAIFLAVLMTVSVLFTALITMVNGASSAALKTELDALQSEATEMANQSSALTQSISDNQSETQSVLEQKAEIDQQMALTNQQIENLEAQIQQYNLLIAAKQEELDQSQLEADGMAEQYKSRLRAMEEAGGVSYWSILFQANSISDLLSRLDDIEDVALADQAMLDQMHAASDAIAAAKSDIEASRQEMEDAKAEQDLLAHQLELQGQQAAALVTQLLAQKDELDIALAEVEEMEAEVRANMAAVQAQYEEALADEEAARLIEEAKQNAANKPTGSTSTGSTSAGFISPISGYYYISCPYGMREHPIYGYYAMHYGADMAASAGTPIYATASGTVTSAYYDSINGYNVSINHNNGFTSLYAHMTNYVVSAGTYVNQGQLIGYVGSTGWSTGAHLHFEMTYGGANVNPAAYAPI